MMVYLVKCCVFRRTANKCKRSSVTNLPPMTVVATNNKAALKLSKFDRKPSWKTGKILNQLNCNACPCCLSSRDSPRVPQPMNNGTLPWASYWVDTARASSAQLNSKIGFPFLRLEPRRVRFSSNLFIFS